MSSRIIKSFRVIEKEEDQKADESSLEETTRYIKEQVLEAEKQSEIILEQARKEAKIISQEAESLKRGILEAAISEADNIKQSAQEEGFMAGKEEGYQTGYQDGANEAEKIIEEVANIKTEALKERERMLLSLEPQIIDMIIKTAEKIINTEVDRDSEVILSIIEKGLDSIELGNHVTIRVSKEDYDIVEMSRHRILIMANMIEELDIKVDKNVEKGGCVIETDNGSADLNLSNQIEEMKKFINEILNGA